MINCIIVDDEQHAIDVLVHYVKETPALNLVGSFTNPIEGMQSVSEQKVDLIFLDIQMPELSGIDFIKSIHTKSKIILTTAYSEFALEGYELYVVDYLLKPIRMPRFLTAVQKAIARIHSERVDPILTMAEDFIFVKTESKGKLLKINLADINFIESRKNYVAIHQGSKITMVYTSMVELEEHLPKRHFIRVHKSFIIPIPAIMGIEGNILNLKNVSVPIMIGEKYKDALMEIIRTRLIE